MDKFPRIHYIGKSRRESKDIEDSRKDVVRFQGERIWYGTRHHKPSGEWGKTAEGMMLNFAESGHPVFRATSALERGDLKSKGKGKNIYSLQRW